MGIIAIRDEISGDGQFILTKKSNLKTFLGLAKPNQCSQSVRK